MDYFKKEILFPLLVTFLLPLGILGQQPFFKNYQVRDGLSSNNVFYVFQDSKGIIWFATDAGILKFDGQHFQKFTTQNGLPDNDVFTLFEDSAGRIWMLNFNGKPGFIQNDQIFSGQNLPILKDIKLLRFQNGILEKENKIIITSASKEYLVIDFEEEKSMIRQIPIATRVMNGWAQEDGKMGFISDYSIGYFGEEQFEETVNLEVVNVLAKSFVQGEQVFISNTSQVILYNSAAKKIEKYYDVSEVPSEIISIGVIENELWIGTRSGLFIADENDKFYQASFDFLKDKSVSYFIKDREGGLWFTTLDAGVFYLPSPQILQYVEEDGLPGNRISALKKDLENNLWIGGDDGRYAVLSPTGKMNSFKLPKLFNYSHPIVEFRHDSPQKTMVNGKLFTLEINGRDTAYNVLSKTSGLYDKDGGYWFGLNQLFYLTKKEIQNWTFSTKMIRNTPDPQKLKKGNLGAKILNKMTVSQLELDGQNRVWVGGTNGLIWYKRENGAILNAAQPIIPYQINSMNFDKRNNILTVATSDQGLFFIKDTTVIHQLPIKENNQSIFITQFAYDTDGNIWVGCLGGLYKVSANWQEVKNYSYVTGIGEEKINAVEVIDNQLFIGKDYGLVKIPMEILGVKNKVNPPVFLSGMKVNLENVEMEKDLSFKYFQNSISFSFHGLSYRDYGKMHYQYRLLGLSENWDSTYSTRIDYKSLDPGNYTFEVKAINGQGVVSEESQHLSFFIEKPFWKKGWFLLISFLIVALGIYNFIKQREKKLKNRYEAQQKLIESENEKLELSQKFHELKLHALRLQMNPHFIFNSLNTIKGYYGAEDIKTANAYIKKFAKLLRVNLEYSDEYIPLEKEIEVLKIYAQLSQLRYPDKFDLEVFVDEKIHLMEFTIPPMLIQPFVENAIIHGLIPKEGKGRLKLSFLLENELLKVMVEDDGIGRKASAKINKNRNIKHKSLAINITRDRLMLESEQNMRDGVVIEDLEDSLHDALGTRTTLLIPLKKLW